jgi:hypothetical protein
MKMNWKRCRSDISARVTFEKVSVSTIGASFLAFDIYKILLWRESSFEIEDSSVFRYCDISL